MKISADKQVNKTETRKGIDDCCQPVKLLPPELRSLHG